MKYPNIKIGFLFLILLVVACHKKDIEPVVKVTISNEKVTLNPTGYSPLTATISLETSINTKVTIRGSGQTRRGKKIISQRFQYR